MEFEVWMEGYAATGNSQGAQQIVNKNKPNGKWIAKEFKHACIIALSQSGWSMGSYNEETNSYWGCGMYDNEADARKHFG